ncbi:MAG: hypothetical protein A2788_00605 [Candidatus Abawacabacteria bacterium RIFCSPHIGHO2_01_FULL_46_8]|uniref:Heme-copper oxidase subunit III family profile domain-containing protein n=1 Tax=Candidatus Abawacabacteria bacterium RIFCSPHIGHO2_01_FULL_46_8 TaxID=1817815 RepID=A0A1F4XI40_9BACT|nr:MAG: hypothetical protein A2788_00605 [Candidatus Abawacabacteria bacterium RIFCSPHIGHO2_01_FULL_46_8]
MLIAGIIFVLLMITLAIGSYFAAYHAINYAAPTDRTRPVLLIYLFSVGLLLIAELIIFFLLDWNNLLTT